MDNVAKLRTSPNRDDKIIPFLHITHTSLYLLASYPTSSMHDDLIRDKYKIRQIEATQSHNLIHIHNIVM